MSKEITVFFDFIPFPDFDFRSFVAAAAAAAGFGGTDDGPGVRGGRPPRPVALTRAFGVRWKLTDRLRVLRRVTGIGVRKAGGEDGDEAEEVGEHSGFSRDFEELAESVRDFEEFSKEVFGDIERPSSGFSWVVAADFDEACEALESDSESEPCEEAEEDDFRLLLWSGDGDGSEEFEES